MKKKLSCRIGLARRLIALVCATTLLFSCLPVGVARQDVKVVKAVAVVDDFCSWFVAQSTMSLFTLACAAGGASSSEYLTPSEKAGITDFPSAKNYVHGSLSGNSDFGKIFSFDPVKMIKTECSIASMSLKMGYTLNKSFFEKLWGTYNPDKEAWDPEKWDTLTEEEKRSYLFSWDKFIEKINASAPFPPDPDYNFDDDEEDTSSEYNEKGEHINSSTGEPDVIPIGTTSDIIASAPFALIYALTKIMNEEDANKKFMEKETQDPDICDYSKGYWKKYPTALTLKSNYLKSESQNIENYQLRFLYLESEKVLNDSDKIYPIMYKNDDGVMSFCYALDKAVSYNDLLYNNTLALYRYPCSSATFVSSAQLDGVPCTSFLYKENQNEYLDSVGMTKSEWVNYVLNNSAVISPTAATVISPNLIRCKKYEDVQKFRQYILSGDYTLQEILDCMEDGWKADRKKSFESVEDGGKTTKKILESEKGDKYTTSGTKKDEKGNTQSNQRGVTYGSIAEGLGSPDGIKGILGDMVNRSAPIKYPAPEDYPGQIGNPQPDPDPEPNPTPEPDLDPEPNSTPVPGTGSEPTPVPGSDDKLDDIDPDKVKTPQLLKKFPFCVPWDIVDLVTVVGAEKKAPKFEIPFKLNSKQAKNFQIDEKIVIDFSEYEMLANICRWFFRLMFIAGLVVLTRYIIKG